MSKLTTTAAIVFGVCLIVTTALVSHSEPPGLAPRVAIQTTDYAADRASFNTQLLRLGPSPQEGQLALAPFDAKDVQFPSGDLHLHAWIGMPPEVKKQMPVVIFLHGGFAFGADDFEMARPYRESGFVVVTPMLRGENGQGGTFTMFYGEVEDVLALVDFVSSLSYIDRSHIYLAGHSVGGTLALLAGMTSSEFRAIASFSASPDQINFLQSPTSRSIAPFDVSNSREVQMRSPLAYAASLKAPTRLYYGTQELAYSRTTEVLAQNARAAHLDVSAQAMPGDHFSAVPSAIRASIAFFEDRR